MSVFISYRGIYFLKQKNVQVCKKLTTTVVGDRKFGWNFVILANNQLNLI